MAEQQPNDIGQPKTPAQYARIFFSGFAMGSVEIVPGVSGGTMAFILGIYETLINAIKSFNLDAIRLAMSRKFGDLVEHTSLRFLIALGLGMGAAIFTLASFLDTAIEEQPTIIFALFGGLIIASVIAIAVKIEWSLVPVIGLILGAAFAFGLAGVQPLQDAGHGPLVLILSGAIAVMALILPGVSGSFMLLILGQYHFILGAVSDLDIATLAFVAIGAVVGILAFSRIVSYLLKNYEHTTVAVLVGFIIGSLRVIWNEAMWIYEEVEGAEGTVRQMTEMRTLDGATIVLALAAMVVGFMAVTVLDHLQMGDNPVLRRFWKLDRAAKSPQAESVIQEKAQALE